MPQAVNQSPGGCGCPSGACQICITAKDCSNAVVAGAAVAVTQGTTTIGTCTTNSLGQCCVTVPSSGTYHVEVSKAGLITYATNVTPSCPTTSNVSATVDASPTFTLTVGGCLTQFGGNIPQPGATVTINGGSYTTDANGQIKIKLDPGTYPYTVTKSRFANGSGNVTITGVCASTTQTIALTAAAGFHCLTTCATPLKDTLIVSDPTVGAVTITWGATAFNGGQGWSGSASYAMPAICGCPAATVALVYHFGYNGLASAVQLYQEGGINHPATTCPGSDISSPWAQTGTTNSFTCFPLNMTSHLRGCGDYQFGQFYPAAGVNCTVTE